MFTHILYNYTPHFFRHLPGFSGNTHNSPSAAPPPRQRPSQAAPPLTPIATRRALRALYGEGMVTCTGKKSPAESAGLSFPVRVEGYQTVPLQGLYGVRNTSNPGICR